MTTLQMPGKGTITLPTSFRKKYSLEEGEVFTIIDLGEGSFLLKPKVLEVDKLSRQIARRLKEDNVTLEDLLETPGEERKEYYQENYCKSKAGNSLNEKA